MSFWELLTGFLAGMVQGAAEWLPISSKTLLIIIFLNLGLPPGQSYLLGLLLNGATSLAAITYFRREILGMLRLEEDYRGILYFIVASIPMTGVVAVPLSMLTLESIGSGREMMALMGVLLIFTGLMAWRSRSLGRGIGRVPSIRDGVLVGAAQGFSSLPGISRSGVTLLTLLSLGYNPRQALMLSFLMGIPATIGGSIYSLMVSFPSSPLDMNIVIPGFIAAILTSIPTIHTLISIASKIHAHIFTWILAALTLATAMLV